MTSFAERETNDRDKKLTAEDINRFVEYFTSRLDAPQGDEGRSELLDMIIEDTSDGVNNQSNVSIFTKRYLGHMLSNDSPYAQKIEVPKLPETIGELIDRINNQGYLEETHGIGTGDETVARRSDDRFLSFLRDNRQQFYNNVISAMEKAINETLRGKSQQSGAVLG